MSMKALKKAVKSANKDTFEVGTVIRWTSSGKYSYAAIKSPVGWYSTAAGYNPYVKQIMTFEELLRVLGRAETSNVEVSSEWEKVS